MAEGSRPSAGRALRRVPTSAVLAASGLVGLLTVVVAALGQWTLAVAGVVVLQLGCVVVALGPWGSRPAPGPPSSRPRSSRPAEADLVDLERRVDALGARLVASVERTRVEVLDALHPGGDVPGDGQR